MDKDFVNLEDIRKAIKDSLTTFEGVDVNSPKAIEAIDKLAKQKMAEIVDMLLYIDEDPDVEQLGYDLYDIENDDTCNFPE